MGLEIPQGWEAQIEEIAKSQSITMDDALNLVIAAGVERFTPAAGQPNFSYASLFGSVSGPGAHGSRDAVDRYLAELRNEW